MKRFTRTTPGALLLIGFLHGLAGAPRLEGKESKTPGALAPSESKVDFGQIWEGDKVARRLQIANTSAAPVKIVRITTTCGCTLAKPSGKDLAPGAKIQFTVQFDSSGRPGKYEGEVYIVTAGKEELRIPLQALVLTEVGIERSYIYFGEVLKGTPRSQEVVLRFYRRGISVTRSELDTKLFKFEEIKEAPAKDPTGRPVVASHRYRITLSPGAPYGFVEGNFFVKTSSERHERFRVFLFARVKGYVQISPTRLNLGFMIKNNPTTYVTRRIEVKSLREEIQILKVQNDDPQLQFLGWKVEVNKRNLPQVFYVEFSIADGKKLPNGPIEGKVHLLTTSKERPSIEIAVEGVAR